MKTTARSALISVRETLSLLMAVMFVAACAKTKASEQPVFADVRAVAFGEFSQAAAELGMCWVLVNRVPPDIRPTT